MHFFKYTKRKFVDKNSFRIGTLYEYRKEYEKGIADADEGKKSVTANIDHYDSNDPQRDPLIEAHTSSLSAGRNILKNVKYINREESPDFYIYSVSSVFDKDLLKDFDADCCFRINNIDSFIRDLTSELNRKSQKANRWIFDRVTYSSRHFDYKNPGNIHPAMLKDKDKYGHQFEWRIVWEPTKRPIEKIDFASEEVGKHIELLF